MLSRALRRCQNEKAGVFSIARDSIYVGGEYLRSLLVSPKKSREVTGSHPDYLPPRPELCVQLLKVVVLVNKYEFICN